MEVSCSANTFRASVPVETQTFCGIVLKLFNTDSFPTNL